jgi:hypothetical protein
MRAAAAFLGGLFDADRAHWYPMLVVVDEAQLFARIGGRSLRRGARLSLGAMTNLMCRGRKRGLAGVIATQRLAKLAKNVAAEASNFLMGRTFLDIDMAARRRPARHGPASGRDVPRPRARPVRRARPGPVAKPLPISDRPGGNVGAVLQPEADAAAGAAGPVPQESGRPTQPELSPEEREERLNAVLSEIIDDPQAAYRTDAALYQDFLVRARMRRLPGAPMGMSDFRRRVAISRAGVDKETAETEGWQTALELSVRVSDDLQGVFLMLAKAALLAEPCPSDMRIAKAYGTHSARRARRLLGYFEEQGLIVVHTDFGGKRIVAFPDLDVQTCPGAPDAPDAEPVARQDAAE